MLVLVTALLDSLRSILFPKLFLFIVTYILIFDNLFFKKGKEQKSIRMISFLSNYQVLLSYFIFNYQFDYQSIHYIVPVVDSLNVAKVKYCCVLQQYYQIINTIHNITFAMNNKFKRSPCPDSNINFYAVPCAERSRTVQNHIISKHAIPQSKDNARRKSIQTQRKLSQKQKESLDDIFAETIYLEQVLQPSKQARTVRQRNDSSRKRGKMAQFQLKNKHYLPIERENHPISKQNQSKDKLRKGQIKIIERKKRKLNSSLMQRIAQTLEHYPCLMGNCYQQQISKFKFSTEQTDQDQTSTFFQMKMINMSKLVLLTEGKLNKNIQGIYDYALSFKGFEKQSRRFTFMTDDSNVSMRKIIKGFLIQKYKTEKLCRQNLVNLCYSLYFHIDRLVEEYSLNYKRNHCILNKIRYYQIFQRFLTFKYDYQDLIFYLYSLSIFRHLIKMEPNLSQLQGLSNQQIQDFLIMLSGNDQQLIQTYKEYIEKSFPGYQEINLYSLLYFLINDYRKKRQYAKENLKISFMSSSSQEETTILKKQDKTEDNNTYSDTQYDYDKQFWSFNMASSQSIQQPLCNLLQNELGYQSKKLMELLCPLLSIQYKTFVNQLLLMKAIRMVNCVNQKSYQLWQQQMKLDFNDTPEKGGTKNGDLIQIERLQRDMKILTLNFNNESLQQRMIIEFAKALLTPRKLLEKLRELIEYFESLMP